MKILHTSDWHFGASLSGTRIYDDQEYFLNQLYDIIERENIDLVICAGDIYDSSITNADSINMYNNATTKICNRLGKKMVVIAGNHDSAARLSACSELLKNAGLFVSGRIKKDIWPELFDDGRVAIYSVPYFNRDEVTAMFPDTKDQIRNQEDAAKVYFDSIRENMDRSRKNIVISHAYIVNSELSESDRAAQVGFATAVSKDVFADFDYVALGHIHKPQIITDRIRYSGSPVKMSFGKEESQQKVVYIYDTDRDEVTETALSQKHEWKSVSGTFEEVCSLTGLEDTYLRVELTDRPVGADTYAYLKNQFPLLLELKGRSFSVTGEESHFSQEQFNSLSEQEILLMFLGEKYGYEPEEEQLNLFLCAVSESEEEGELG